MALHVARILLALLAVAPAWARPAAAAASAPPRNLIVLFQFLENANGAEQALDFLFASMLRPGDRLVIQTPLKRYAFFATTRPRARAEWNATMRVQLRSDISRAARDTQQVLADLEALALEISELAYPTGAAHTDRDLNELFMRYRSELSQLNRLRRVPDAALRLLASSFQGWGGESHLIVLFEREFRPIPRREALNVLGDMPVFGVQANELFATSSSRELFDTAAMAAYFRSLPLTQHFVYVPSKNAPPRGNLIENSGDVYSAFSRLAQASGGVQVTTAEPMEGLRTIWKTGREKPQDDRHSLDNRQETGHCSGFPPTSDASRSLNPVFLGCGKV